MHDLKNQEPPRWRELCSELQREKDPANFQALVEELDRVMTAHEKGKSKAAKLP